MYFFSLHLLGELDGIQDWNVRSLTLLFTINLLVPLQK